MGDRKLTFPKAPFPIALRIWKWSKSTAGGENRNVALQLAVAIGDHSAHVAETIHAPRSNLSRDLLQLGAAQSAVRTPSSSPGRRLTRPVEVYVRFSREAAAHGRSSHVSTALETLQLASPTCIPRTDVPGALFLPKDRRLLLPPTGSRVTYFTSLNWVWRRRRAQSYVAWQHYCRRQHIFRAYLNS